MLCLVRAKACKRCGGDLSLECDIYGIYAQCIQCGANWSKKVMMRPTEEGFEIVTEKAGTRVPPQTAGSR
jgi:hypothetical protein